MIGKGIAYRAGYKYQLDDHHFEQTALRGHEINESYLRLDPNGLLTITKGYAWDGPSGPTIDTRSFMRGSLVHDALYQLIRLGHLGHNSRLHADELLREICRQDGMNPVRAWWVYHSVRIFGRPATMPSATRPVQRAP